MSENNSPNTGEGYKIRPFYLCIDVSGSMGPSKTGSPPWPIDVVNQDLAALLEILHDEIEASETIKLALLSFATSAKLDSPLSDPDDIIALPELKANGQTSYLQPLQKLREVIDQDFEKRKPNKWYRPVVIFVTDGFPNCEPDHEWHAARDRLLDLNWPAHPIFVVFGFGQANKEVIKTLATGQKYTGVACLATQNETITNQIRRIMSKLQKSIIYSAGHPSQFVLDTEGLLVVTEHDPDTSE